MSYDYVKFEDLLGQTLVEINVENNEVMTFITKEGKSYRMYHDQDCCESVRIEDIVGDLKDLLGNPLLKAEESTNQDNPPEHADSYTWTFYKLATIKGYVDVRWLGESNGYYSESVSIYKGRDYTPEEIQEFMNNNNISEKIDIYQTKKKGRYNL